MQEPIYLANAITDMHVIYIARDAAVLNQPLLRIGSGSQAPRNFHTPYKLFLYFYFYIDFNTLIQTSTQA